MQLKIQRSQRVGGVLGNTVFFCLDVRADYSPEEQSNVCKYKLGPQVIYNSKAARRHLDKAKQGLDRTQSDDWKESASGLASGMVSLAMSRLHLNISIASLARGHHIECRDLPELLEAEQTVREACKSVTNFLAIAETFNGSEIVVEYIDGEEQEHVAQNAPPLISYETEHSEVPPSPTQTPPPEPTEQPAPSSSAQVFGVASRTAQDVPNAAEAFMRQWSGFENRVIAFADERGCTLSLLQVRICAVVTGLLTFYILAKIL